MKTILVLVVLSFIAFACDTESSSKGFSTPVGVWTEVAKLDSGFVWVLFQSTDGIVWAGSDRGLFKSKDNGESWKKVIANVPILSFLENKNKILFAGTTMGMHRSLDNGITWSLDTSGMGIPLEIPSLFDVNGSVFAGTWKKGIFFSTNGGLTWLSKNKGIEFPNSHAFSCFTIDAKGSLFVGSSSGVYKSTDLGGNWSIVGHFAWGSSIISLNDSSIICTDAHVENLGRTTDGGESWTSFSVQAQIWSIIQTSHQTVMCPTTHKGVLVSHDNGLNWNPYNDSLSTKESYYSIVQLRNGEILIGSRSGRVFKTRE